jgi:hypothetical protein
MYEDLQGLFKKVAAAVIAKDLSFQDYIDLNKGQGITTQNLKRIVN